jgi:hypothetical protein
MVVEPELNPGEYTFRGDEVSAITARPPATQSSEQEGAGRALPDPTYHYVTFSVDEGATIIGKPLKIETNPTRLLHLMLERGAPARGAELWACTGPECLKPSEPDMHLQDAWAPLERALPTGRNIADNPLSAIFWLIAPPEKAAAAAELGAKIWSFADWNFEGHQTIREATEWMLRTLADRWSR